MNDWDRHRRQWRWAQSQGESLLQPIPEDPDYAFTDYEGLTLAEEWEAADQLRIMFQLGHIPG